MIRLKMHQIYNDAELLSCLRILGFTLSCSLSAIYGSFQGCWDLSPSEGDQRDQQIAWPLGTTSWIICDLFDGSVLVIGWDLLKLETRNAWNSFRALCRDTNIGLKGRRRSFLAVLNSGGNYRGDTWSPESREAFTQLEEDARDDYLCASLNVERLPLLQPRLPPLRTTRRTGSSEDQEHPEGPPPKRRIFVED